MVLSGRNACPQYLQILKQVGGNDQSESLGVKRLGEEMVSRRNDPDIPERGPEIDVERCCVFTLTISAQCHGNTRNLHYLGYYGNAIKT